MKSIVVALIVSYWLTIYSFREISNRQVGHSHREYRYSRLKKLGRA
jgi:hypothetical protein